MIKIIPFVSDNRISIDWIDESKKTKCVGVFNVIKNHNNDNEMIIYGYKKTDKTINGYQFIKMSIDYILSLGYNIISIANRSDDAIKVWGKLEVVYNVETEPAVIGDQIKHSLKRLTSKK